MDTLDGLALLYLSKKWDGQGTLLEYTQKFQQIKAELSKALTPDLSAALDRGDFSF